MLDTWREPVAQQLSATAKLESLSAHRSLVENRFHLLKALVSASTSPSKLSPNSQQLKRDVFQVDGPLKDASFKSYKKKLTSMVQSLTNASDRLNSVFREETCS